jgi:two-component system CheB/CheR fusion protein
MAATDPSFESLIDFIRTDRAFDFTAYKRPSLERRFRKRMQALHIDEFDGYRTYLERNADEFNDLFNTILINVTTFFRDVPAWDYVRGELVPRIVEEAAERDTVRMWSTGCSSGEEAYTLAIVFAEAMNETDFRDRVKIYATDVDEEALAEARHGVYPASRIENVPEDLLERYFERLEPGYVVKPELRQAVIFGRQDVVQDPPISRIDLLASRNTLMYFTKEAQERILANFHFALRAGGYLFLGKSEMMLARSGLFEPLDLKRRVFQKVARSDAFRYVPRTPPEPRSALLPDGLMRDVAFESAPIAQLVIDREGTLSLANMQVRKMFRLAQHDVGKPFKDLEISYRPVELRSQIDRAKADRHPIVVRDVHWTTPNGDDRTLDVQIVPLVGPDGQVAGVGVSFVDVTRFKQLSEALVESKREVETAFEELQSTVEEMETTNEELQSTNEELETTNEELHSTNEELETMNEELQSTNEELETMNDELNQRTDEIDQTNTFLESILRSFDAAVVVLDGDMRVSAWNDGAQELWGLRRDEVQGQHFLSLDIGLPLEQLRNAIRDALAGEDLHAPFEVDAMNRRGRAITTRVQLSPLRADGGVPLGVTIFMEQVE